ncbi:MAG: hypothetical protein ACT4P6_20545 [Gemmatimonadaceae bacterium]
MYSHCIFCQRQLGQNEVFPTFRVGKRLAFDSNTGRLWVICTKCGGWCLTPVEERWEIVRECERLVAATSSGAAAHSISIHPVGRSLELVRIGGAEREIALWRYGQRLVTRRVHAAVQESGLWLLRVVPGLAASIPLISATSDRELFGFGLLTVAAAVAGGMLANRFERSTLRRLIGFYHDGKSWQPLIFAHALSARLNVLGEAPGWRVQLDASIYYYNDAGHIVHDAIVANLDSATSLTTLRAVMPRINRYGASTKTVDRALALCASHKDLQQLFVYVTEQRGRWPTAPRLRELPVEARLAIEMAVNREVEECALRGELEQLAAEWLVAEEIAKVADDLTIPPSVVRRLNELKQQAASRAP